ncbi:YqcI/YcgG family protein [Lysinibacillus cavernae]|uniref:YqcI/YcgG family protein n=1 Tax=Lysinibacillus cavernae TaxID=2666135 RepID=UPI0012D96846|nr:YqcI/YcgG family protein [Lysinibacillus cavernae]
MEVGVFDRKWIEEHLDTLPFWQQSAYTDFAATIADEENTFPCVPARMGFLSNHLRYSFIEDPRKEQSINELAQCLKEFTESSRTFGKYTTLTVFFHSPQDMLASYKVEDYQQLFWTILNHLTKIDDLEWPEEIPTDPAHNEWEFCFNGEPYFISCATPAHKMRRSRHFSTLLMAIQPRWIFEEMNDSTAFGRKLKKLIRQRIANYDALPGHPDLKWYGQEDSYEWKQYFLSDDNQSPPKCPFLRMSQK